MSVNKVYVIKTDDYIVSFKDAELAYQFVSNNYADEYQTKEQFYELCEELIEEKIL